MSAIADYSVGIDRSPWDGMEADRHLIDCLSETPPRHLQSLARMLQDALMQPNIQDRFVTLRRRETILTGDQSCRIFKVANEHLFQPIRVDRLSDGAVVTIAFLTSNMSLAFLQATAYRPNIGYAAKLFVTCLPENPFFEGRQIREDSIFTRNQLSAGHELIVQLAPEESMSLGTILGITVPPSYLDLSHPGAGTW